MDFQATVLHMEFVTHNVMSFILSKPAGFTFVPGQGIDLAVDRPNWREEIRPFSMTSLPEDHVLEFIIKDYPERHGVTERMTLLKPGDHVLLGQPFGSLVYRGKGTFIAGGTGITPMLAILRDMARRGEIDGQQLIFTNHAPRDIIAERELQHYLGDRCVLTCTQVEAPGYRHGRVDQDLLQETIADLGQYFYVCGPPGFTKDVRRALLALGAAADHILI